MKTLKLIYNPNAGDKSFKTYLDTCIKVFQKGGYETTIHRCTSPNGISKHFQETADMNWDAIVIAGGDGSLNLAVNAMMKYNVESPIGIIPAGTANDFARFLKIPDITSKAAEVICNGKIKKIDLGLVNDEKYFINICAAGMVASISQNVDVNFKNYFGKIAYYVKGIEQIPNLIPLNLRITNNRETIDEKLFFFFLLNSAGSGGFEKLSIGAKIDDGLFDFVGFRVCSIIEIPKLLVKVIAGDYLDDNNIIFFRDNYVKIECLETPRDPSLLVSDVDGEQGVSLPLEIKNLHKVLNIFVPNDFE